MTGFPDRFAARMHDMLRPTASIQLMVFRGDEFAEYTDRVVFWAGSVRSWLSTAIAWIRATP